MLSEGKLKKFECFLILQRMSKTYEQIKLTRENFKQIWVNAGYFSDGRTTANQKINLPQSNSIFPFPYFSNI